MILEPELSAASRDQLMAEISDINSAEEAANWAHRVLASKNTLAADDATRVEQAFQSKLAAFAGEPVVEPRSLHEPEDRARHQSNSARVWSPIHSRLRRQQLAASASSALMIDRHAPTLTRKPGSQRTGLLRLGKLWWQGLQREHWRSLCRIRRQIY